MKALKMELAMTNKKNAFTKDISLPYTNHLKLVKYYYDANEKITLEFGSEEEVLSSIKSDESTPNVLSPCCYSVFQDEKLDLSKLQDFESIVSKASLGIFNFEDSKKTKNKDYVLKTIDSGKYKSITIIKDWFSVYDKVVFSNNKDFLSNLIPNWAIFYKMPDMEYKGDLYTGFFFHKVGCSSFMDTRSGFECINSESKKLQKFFDKNLRTGR